MPLVLDPPTAKFAANGEGESVVLQLINYTQRRFCFKIKSTNNSCYRVMPVYGFVDPESRTPVELIRRRGMPGWDNFVVEWRGVADGETEPWAPFQRAAGTYGGSEADSKIRNEEKELGEIVMPVQAK